MIKLSSLVQPLACALALLVLLSSTAQAADTLNTVNTMAPNVGTSSGDSAFLGARLQRTMTLLATSDQTYRPPMRILCYGQSIIAQKHVSNAIEAMVRERYPLARVEVMTPAIGGYEADKLVRTAKQDIAPLYPDLVVLHVYSGHGNHDSELERIISDIRRDTTAEILLWTHHLDSYGDDGTARDAGRDQESNSLRRLAQKYNCELVELRETWRAHLKANPQLKRRDLLVDNIHLNQAGGKLLADTVMRHFRYSTIWPSWWADTVRSYEVRRPLEEQNDEIHLDAGWKRVGTAAGSETAGASLRLRFDGNRVVAWLPALKQSGGTARVLVDGKPPSAWPESYSVTRVGSCGVGWFPVINRILPGGSPIPEKWTITFSEVNENGNQYRFAVRGSITGEDGGGNQSSGEFVSRSGRLRFSTRDISLATTAHTFKQPLPDRFEITCETLFHGTDFMKNPSGAEAESVFQVLVQGIPNREHSLEIVPIGDGTIALTQLLAHHPPLR
jgi:hypothetical protein